MSYIHFITGSMFSGKSRELIDFIRDKREQGERVLVMKPTLDTRDNLVIKSRDREEEIEALGITDSLPELYITDLKGVKAIVVDEVQFLSPKVIDSLVTLSGALGIPLVLGGLTYDFKDDMFPAISYLYSKYKPRVRTSVLPAFCVFCGRESLAHSRRVINGEIVLEGEVNFVGDSDCYIAVCKKCLKV